MPDLAQNCFPVSNVWSRSTAINELFAMPYGVCKTTGQAPLVRRKDLVGPGIE